MKLHYVFIMMLIAIKSYAHTNKEFAAFARTKDSLMHIAFYDNNFSAFKKYMNEFVAGYNKLDDKDKNDFKEYLDNEQYYLACIYAKAGNNRAAMENLKLSGTNDYGLLVNDKNLDKLRSYPAFIEYLNNVKQHTSKDDIKMGREGKMPDAHTKKDYVRIMERFKNNYNDSCDKCIDSLISPTMHSWWKNGYCAELKKNYGNIRSTKYLGMEADNFYENDALFEVRSDSMVYCTAISLDKHNRIETFRFETNSAYIDWRLAKELDKEKGKH